MTDAEYALLIARIASRISQAARLSLSTWQHVQVDKADAIRERGQPGMGVRVSGISDPTYHQIRKLQGAEKREAALIDFWRGLNRYIDTGERTHERVISDREFDKPRCKGDGTPEGATCWQVPGERMDPATDQIIDDGRCVDCGPRYDKRRSDREIARRKRRHGHDAA